MAGGPEAGARTRADGRGAARALAAPADGLVPAVPVVAPAPLAGGGPWRLPARLAAALGALLAEEVEDRRGTLFLPVGFAIGVALYLGAGGEPSPYAGPLAFAVLLALALAARARPFAFYALALAATLAAGFTVASLQVQRIAHPVLAAPLSGVTVNGFVEQAELRPRGSRIVVRVTSLERAPQLVPERVRIALAAAKPPPVGAHVSLRADLAAPPGPAYPGGFDFGRAAWFEGIGATGYAVGKWRETPAPGPPDRSLAFAAWLEASRQAMAARIRAVLPGEAGGVAVALVTGIRGQVPEPLEEAMRISGLAHVLSISGLHMALVATTVFFFARALLALWPGLALTRPIKAWAAVPALAAATYYLLLSGAEVATQRSYVMTVLVLAGVMLGRPALTLHTLALAALLVLALTPWAILDPGAQMSFAATLALVVAYERGGRHLIAAGAGRLPWYASMPARWLVALALTSLAAGLATAPYAAYHFQRLAPLSLFANLAATPLVSFVIMPMGLLGTLAMPFGWEGPPFRLMGWGIDAMNGVARWVAAMPGADGGVRAMPLASLALITFAFLAACLLRTRLALVALVLAGAAGWPILAARTPDVLVDAQARTVAVRGPDGQLSLMGDRTKGLAERFAAEQWLSAEGRRGQGREPAALSRGASVPASPAATAGKAPSPGSPLPGSPLPFAQEASPAGPVRSTKDGASGAGSLPAMRGAAESGAVPHAGEGGNAGPSLLLPTFVMPAGIELPPQQEQGGPDVSRPAAPDALAPARAAPPEVATIPTEAVAVPAASGASRGDAGPPLARPADPGTSIDAGLQAKRIPSSGAAGEPWGNAGPTPDSPAGSSGPARIPLAQLAAEVAMSVPLVAEAVPASSRDSSDLPPPTSAATPFVSALTPPSQPPDPAAATSAPPASAVLPTSARGSRDPAPSASVATLFASERSLTPAAATSAPPASAVLPASVRGSSDPAPSASVATPFASERPLAPEAATSAPPASAVLPTSARGSR
ncbi:ComEC/Rec2 family competence protein, partial [Ancylobacter oerskovii]|uniref:ComEC/Rec2 family competence protein n=1 Tax=Ancylobacter oerskovii TaxID=459519 RepID=UPI001BCBC851